MVTATVTVASSRVAKIEPSVVDAKDVQMLRISFCAAVNQAITKARPSRSRAAKVRGACSSRML